MGLFDIVNTVTGGKAQEHVDRVGENAVATMDIRNANPTYGGGAVMPNPAFTAWNQKKMALEQQLANASTVEGFGLRQQIAALGPAPPETLQPNLGQDVAAVRDTGAAMTAQQQANAADVRQTGANAAATQQMNGSYFQGLGDAAQGRAGPQMQVQTGGRRAQQSAFGAAQAFTPNANGAESVRASGVNAAANIRQAGTAAAKPLAAYEASREGVNALQQFAKGPTGPSAAEAMLRLQAARDKASALSRARSARGGPGAVNEAMKVAQAEGAAQSADTRGQLALVQAQEAAQRRGESLQALTSAGSLIGQNDATRLNALTSAGTLGVQSATSAGQLGVQGQTAATQAELEGSAQALQAVGLQQQGATAIRSGDIDVAKANLGAELQTLQMNDQQTQFFSQLGEQARQAGIQAQATAQATGINADQAAAQASLQYAQQAWNMLSADQQAQIQQIGIARGVIAQNNASDAATTQQTMQFLGTALMAGATVKSDRRAKHDIKRLRSMANALRRTPGSTYRYKDSKDGGGEYTGPMAQDLESTREFRGAVVERGGKKTVDTGRLVMSHHAALSDLQRQIDRIEKLGRGKKSAEA